MVAVAIAMGWGTYLESTHGVKVSRATVYGSWWFIVLMALICVSIVFAVITRQPWKRRHVGLITVHTGLVMLIVGGFWSLFGRVEGHIGLSEGTSSNLLETDQEIVSVAEFKDANASPLAEAPAPHRAASLSLAGLRINVTEFWDNCAEEQFVANDNPQPFRAVEVATSAVAIAGQWVGEETKAGGPSTVDGVLVRAHANGTDWTPPPPPAAPTTSSRSAARSTPCEPWVKGPSRAGRSTRSSDSQRPQSRTALSPTPARRRTPPSRSS
jgi:hypothetical protein